MFDLWSFEHDIQILRMNFKVEVLSLKLSLKQTFEVKDLSLTLEFAVMLRHEVQSQYLIYTF